MAMTDEDIERWACTVWDADPHSKRWSEMLRVQRQLNLEQARREVDALQAKGWTITPPPAPEPTYTIRLTQRQRKAAFKAMTLGECVEDLDHEAMGDVYGLLLNTTPDPEPGA